MKKIFIDGGARVGESIEIYVKNNPDLIGCDIHLFECNPNHLDKLNTLQTKYPEYNMEVHQLALWNSEGEQDFYFSIDIWGDLGCTLNKDKGEKLDLDNPIKVKSISLSNFLNQFNDDDYVIVKLDIEGAEWEVVNDLIETNQLSKINELYVEWHDKFFSHDFDSLKQKLKTYPNLIYKNWEF
jgi:FkbM family methyltransferase